MGKSVARMTPREAALYRVKLQCKIGRDAIEGKMRLPDATSALEYSMFCLLHAVEDIALAIEMKKKG